MENFSRLFQRWDIESGSFFDGRNAGRIIRWLRIYGPREVVTVNDFDGRLFYRLGEVLHNGAMLAAVRHLSGGTGCEVDQRVFTSPR